LSRLPRCPRRAAPRARAGPPHAPLAGRAGLRGPVGHGGGAVPVSAPAGLVEARWPAWPVSGPAAELLWGETGAGTFHAARDNAARALRVLRRALARDLAGGAAREFVGLSGGLAAAALAVFEPVWADPRAYAWMRAAHALAASGAPGGVDA